jgi:hypothetical protein
MRRGQPLADLVKTVLSRNYIRNPRRSRGDASSQWTHLEDFLESRLRMKLGNAATGISKQTAPLCQAFGSPVVGWRLAGPVSDWSEVLAKGCEPAALDA